MSGHNAILQHKPHLDESYHQEVQTKPRKSTTIFFFEKIKLHDIDNNTAWTGKESCNIRCA